ncbi:MAG TPA: hypothetical protein VFB45_26625 [Pseudolabrys sp.]|nr:hypothetical protein [Pseudolabrys sp.]
MTADRKIIECERQAESCLEKSDLAADPAKRLMWMRLAQEWLKTAAEIAERKRLH